jgi:hypothetical protein
MALISFMMAFRGCRFVLHLTHARFRVELIENFILVMKKIADELAEKCLGVL